MRRREVKGALDMGQAMNLAIIGASYLQLPLINKAKKLGYKTHVFAWQVHDVGECAADFFYPISITEKEMILEQCRKIKICGICSIASDLAMLTVNYVANKMGLAGNSIEATQKSTNKYLMRQTFLQNGDPSPKCILIDKNTDFNKIDFHYPAIVKPIDRSGSRGITKLDDSFGLEKAIESAMQLGFEKKVLIEEFIEGQEYSVECISYQGNHHFLAMTQKYTTGAPHFIETGHLEPAPVDMITLEKVKHVVYHALDSLGIQNGASHSEFKIDSQKRIWLIEIGGRMGGDCIGSHLVPYATGYDFVKMVIEVACGFPPELIQHGNPHPTEIRYVINKEDLDTLQQIQLHCPEKILDIIELEPANIGKITDSSNRAGCFIFKV